MIHFVRVGIPREVHRRDGCLDLLPHRLQLVLHEEEEGGSHRESRGEGEGVLHAQSIRGEVDRNHDHGGLEKEWPKNECVSFEGENKQHNTAT